MTKSTRLTTLLTGIIFCLTLYLLGIYLSEDKNKREQLQCASQLKQVGQAIGMYVADNDGYLPSRDEWIHGNIPGLPKSGCPRAEKAPQLTPPLPDIKQVLPGYAFNGSLAGRTIVADGRLRGTRLPFKDLQHPQTTIAVFDYTSGIASTSVLDFYKVTGNSWPKVLTKGWERHNGGGNYLFCDGHVSWVKESQLLVTEPDICDGNKSLPHFCVEHNN